VIKLDISGCGVGSNAIKSLMNSLENNNTIQKLNVARNCTMLSINQEQVKSLSANRVLRELYMDSNTVSKGSGRYIGEILELNKSIIKLEIGEN
jgi:hypothetical protein